MNALLSRVADLATEADEAGENTLCVALLHVVEGMKLPSAVARRLVNTQSLMLETIRSAMKEK